LLVEVILALIFFHLPFDATANAFFHAQNVALAAADCNSQLIYISTDYVFDGESARDYAEYDYANPINHYGKSKYYGEMMSARLCQRLYVVRSSWLFGHSERGYIARILAQHEQGVVRMADDQLEAPTYTAHLAAALERLWQSECYGVYHISGGRGCTRIEFARGVLTAAGLNTAVEAADRAAVLAKRVARRPARVVLDCMLYQEVCATALPTWEEGIKEYFRREPYRR